MKKEKRRALEKDLEEQENSGGSEEDVNQNNTEESESKIEEIQESAKQGHKENELLRSKEDTKKKTNKIVYSDESIDEEMMAEPKMKWIKQSKSQGTQTDVDVECDSNEDCYKQKKKNIKQRKDADPSLNERQEETSETKIHEEYLPIDHKSNLSLSDKQSSLKSFDSLLLDELWKLRSSIFQFKC